jgi:DNA-directed RNA polymerase specialized sigma24 family protein
MRHHIRIAHLGELETPSTLDRNDLEADELCQVLRHAIQDLSVRERDAIAAVARTSGESCREVASRYGTCPQTVYNWARSAKDKLRRQLEVCL